MYKLSQAVALLLRFVGCVYFLLVASMAYAGAGHDHGHGHDEPEVQPTVAATPRLTMVSSQFELVGVLNEKGFQLYLDDYISNTPITNAIIEVELAGKTLKAKANTDGSYHITLQQELDEGLYPIVVTIVTETTSDLLAGKLDVRHNDISEQAEEKASSLGVIAQAIHPSWIVAISVSLLLLFGFVLLRDRQKRHDKK